MLTHFMNRIKGITITSLKFPHILSLKDKFVIFLSEYLLIRCKSKPFLKGGWIQKEGGQNIIR